ncbi:MAG: methylenetetrahydrofolate reductase [NAD(P)H], partial [Flavobacteriaceae bacterium]|nr:methylenetetrahydrofolate reductase [NAD(P)H] [Flavobacteriaceae bacterium]
REGGINVPIIPGLKPLATLKQLNMIPHRFHVDLPQDLINEVQKAKDNTAVSEIGVDWCIQQSKELKNHGVPFLHYYSMGKSKNVKKIASSIF